MLMWNDKTERWETVDDAIQEDSVKPLGRGVEYHARYFEGDMCSMCGKDNGQRLRANGDYFCAQCWRIWNS